MMTDEHIKLFGGLAIALIVGIITAFKEEIINSFGTKQFKYLKGQWTCEWHEDPNRKYGGGQTINDSITITKVFGKLIKGYGSTGTLGKWKINGRISECVIAFSYIPQSDSKKHNLGVVILEVGSNKTLLTGKWYQYNSIELVGGITTWKKV